MAHIFVRFCNLSRMTFIADERFQAYFKEELKQWVLQIKYVQPRDVGLYECQVSTEPKVSARAYLHVVGKCENNKYFNCTLNCWTNDLFSKQTHTHTHTCALSLSLDKTCFAFYAFSVPRTELIGDPDRYVKTGSTVHLQCIIYGAIEPPTYIMWYHDAQPIHADNKLGYKMHLIKSNMQRNTNNNNDAIIKYELNDLVQSPFDDSDQRQNSVCSDIST